MRGGDWLCGGTMANASRFGDFALYEALTRHDAESSTFGKQAAFFAGLAALIAALNFYAPARPELEARILASAAIALSAIPTWLWLAGIDRNMPLMPYFGMVFSTYFTVPLFILRDYRTLWSLADTPAPLIDDALWYTLIGLACVMAGYYGPQHQLISRALPRMTMRWTRPGVLKLSGIGFGLLGMMLYLYGRGSLSASFSMFFVFGSDLCMIGMALLFAMQLLGGLDRVSKLFLGMVLVPARRMSGLVSGLTSQGLIVMLLLIYVHSALRHRISWTVILAGGLLFVIVRPVETAFRLATWDGGASENLSELARGKLLLGMVGDSIGPMLEGRGTAYDSAMEVATRRLGADILTFAAVIHDTPGIVPYWNGASYYPILFKFVPRFIYPDKPKEVTGQTFGHRYGLLDPANFETSYNLPQLIEAYINFGPVGVVVVMFLLGLLYRAVQTIFVHPGMGFGALVSCVYLSILLLQVEAAASLIFGGLIWGFIYVGLLNLVIQSGELEHSAVARAFAAGE